MSDVSTGSQEEPQSPNFKRQISIKNLSLNLGETAVLSPRRSGSLIVPKSPGRKDPKTPRNPKSPGRKFSGGNLDSSDFSIDTDSPSDSQKIKVPGLVFFFF